MKNTVSTVIVVIIAATIVECGADLIDDTCSHTPYPETCISAVRSDPRSKTANTPKLGLIVVDKLADNLDKDVKKIKHLIQTEKDPKVKDALTECSYNYKVVILGNLIDSARQAFSFGNPKFAEEAMSSSTRITQRCESGFDGKSPIKAENTLANHLSAVATAIARLLL